MLTHVADNPGQLEGNPYGDDRSLATKLSAESLEALTKETEQGVEAPQPPLAVYLATSYLEEAAEFSDIQAAIECDDMSSRVDTAFDSSNTSGNSPLK